MLTNQVDLIVDLRGCQWQRRRGTEEIKMRPVHLVVIGAVLGFVGCFATSDESQSTAGRPKEQSQPVDTRSLLRNAREEASRGEYLKADLLVQQALGSRDEVVATNDPDVDSAFLRLADTFDENSIPLLTSERFNDAELPLRNALLIREKTTPTNYAAMGTTLNNLASLYTRQGKPAEAERLFRRALRIKEETYGPDDPIVADALGNLAASCREQGKYADSDSLSWRALAIEEKEFGLDDFRVGGSLIALATSYRDQGRFAEAEPLYRRAIANWEKALGRDHVMVADVLRGFATLKEKAGDRQEAESLRQRAEAIRANGIGYQGEVLKQGNP